MKTPPKKKAAAKTAKVKPAAKDIVKGWACPCCPRVHAPTVTECTCRQEAMGKKIHDEAESRKALKDYIDAIKERDRTRPRPAPFQWPSPPPHPYEQPRPPEYPGPYFKPYCYEPILVTYHG